MQPSHSPTETLPRTSANTNTTATTTINELYGPASATYFAQYSGSVILFFIITSVIVVALCYLHAAINFQPIAEDWVNQRCNPKYMPFAGWITHPDGVTAAEYTAQNFAYCTQNVLSSITGTAVAPLTHTTNVLQNMAANIQQSLQSIRAMFDKVRSSLQAVSEEIMGRVLNTMIPLQQMILSVRDIIGKIQGTMTAGLFTALGSYYSLKSLLGAIAEFLVNILIALAATIAILWITPFTWTAAAANTTIFAAIAVPFAVILSFMSKTLHVDTKYNIPKIKCFHPNVRLPVVDLPTGKACLRESNRDVAEENAIEIQHVKIGDILGDNIGEVTAIIIVEARDSTLLQMPGNVIVSDTHLVQFIDDVGNDNWIRSKHYPCCKQPAAMATETDVLYCLNTTSNTIIPSGSPLVYSDWDETANNLQRSPHAVKHATIAHNNIVRNTGEIVDVNKIQIGDELWRGEKVYGVVYTRAGKHLLTTDGYISVVASDVAQPSPQPLQPPQIKIIYDYDGGNDCGYDSNEDVYFT